MAEYPSTIVARPRGEWHEDDGPALWWRFPIQEPPYVGSPLDTTFEVLEGEGYYTHWSPIPIPMQPPQHSGNDRS